LRLRYTLRAAAELDKVLGSIAAQSPQGAHKVQKRIQTFIALLLQHPLAGQRVSKGRLRLLSSRHIPISSSTGRRMTRSSSTACAMPPAILPQCRGEK
jgi:plasmid stabilization system protein ParE